MRAALKKRRTTAMQANVAARNAAPLTDPEVLDIRGMPSPANVLCVLSRVSALPPGGRLQIRSDCNPYQLYDLLQQRGFALGMEKEMEGSYVGTIVSRNIAALRH
jgi:uncharacterized protein (DUF2249 family)